jgi:hemerythrin-like domain-containing protein
MSAIKPIKRSEHIVKLSKDHHLSLLFCWKIRNGLKAAVEPVRIIKYVAYFWQHHMKPHFMEEESILFAPVADDKVQQALDEHASITRQIKSLHAAEEDIVARLSALADMVDDHVRYEERELFPHLEQVLSKEQLISIGEALAPGDEAGLKDDYPDDFWMKNKTSL